MYNKNKLKAAIASKGLNQAETAKMIGMSAVTFNRKLQKGTFGIDEANALTKILDIKNPCEIFFAN